MERKRRDYYRPTKPLAPTMRAIRSAISSGSELLHGLDHRSAWARRLNDLIVNHEQDLGGHDLLSEAQISVVRRCSMMQLQLELMEQKWSANGGYASEKQLGEYLRASNSLRRCYESLGLNTGRKPRDITSLGDILRQGHRTSEAAP